MEPATEPTKDLRSPVFAVGLGVAVTGGFIVAAWLLGADAARAVADRMKVNAAIGFACAGLALVLRSRRTASIAGDALSLVPALIGFLTLLQYATGVDLGIDQLIQREFSSLDEAAPHPGRPAPNTAFALLCVGLAVFGVSRSRVAVFVAQGLAVLAFFAGFSAAVGYLFEAQQLYQPTTYIRMSGLSAIAASALGLALLALRTDLGIGARIAADDAGGYVLRRAGPMVIALPVMVGYVRMHLQQLGVIDTATGAAFLVVTLTVLSGTAVVFLAASVSLADDQRRTSERALAASAKLTAALSRATTVDEVARVVVNEGASALGAAGASLLLPTADGEHLEVRGTSGYGESTISAYQRVRADAPFPAAEAWRSGQPVFVARRDEMLARYPTVPPQHLQYEAWAALPLVGRDRLLGVIALSFPSPRGFEGAGLEQLTTFAWHCAQAVERAVLLDAERTLRAAAERTMTELRAAQQDAVAANKTKDEFLAMLGHELRNPLAPIAIALDMLDRRKETALMRERKIISRQVKHMMRMVDDLLDVSRIARGKIELTKTRVELYQVVTKAVEMAAPLFEQKQHNLLLDVPERGLPLWGDEHRLTQVVSNLLTNAARYTNDGGHIEVRASRRDGRVLLSVKDDGDGIDPAQLPNLFEAFVQAPVEQRSSAGGLGLGLALVKRFTEMHGGTVRGESPGLTRGSTFTVELPLASATEQQPDATKPVRRTPAGEGKRVLVVDDNVDAAELLAEGLRAEGHDVQVANDGPRALDLAVGHKPDVAFLDLGLPAMDGYEVAAKLRELDRRVVLVAVTGYGQPSDRARTAAAGFQHHLVKPVDLETTLGIARSAAPQHVNVQ